MQPHTVYTCTANLSSCVSLTHFPFSNTLLSCSTFTSYLLPFCLPLSSHLFPPLTVFTFTFLCFWTASVSSSSISHLVHSRVITFITPPSPFPENSLLLCIQNHFHPILCYLLLPLSCLPSFLLRETFISFLHPVISQLQQEHLN